MDGRVGWGGEVVGERKRGGRRDEGRRKREEGEGGGEVREEEGKEGERDGRGEREWKGGSACVVVST